MASWAWSSFTSATTTPTSTLAGSCGKVGSARIAYFTVEYSQQRRIPAELFPRWASRTNIFSYLGVHYVDLIYFLTGAVPQAVMAIGTRGILAARGIETLDSIHALVRWRGSDDLGGFVSQFAVNWVDPDSSTAVSDQKYSIIGEKGRLDLDQKHRGIYLAHETRGAAAINPYFSDFLPDVATGRERYQGYGPASIARFLRDVADVKSGKVTPADLDPVRPTFAQGLVSTAVLDGVNRSLANGGLWVELDTSAPSPSRAATTSPDSNHPGSAQALRGRRDEVAAATVNQVRCKHG